MNCKQIEELLPLYVSRDLEAARERLVAAHLQSCIACSGAAGEYRQTRQLLQEFAPPAFSEDFYAAIRQNVWRQIESEASVGSRWDAVIDLFRPRLAWAFAAVVLIAVTVFGIYLIANRSSVPERIAGTGPATNSSAQRKESSRPPEGRAPDRTVTPNEVPKEQLLAGRRTPPRRTHRSVVTDRIDPVIVARSAPSLMTDINTSAPQETVDGKSSEKTLRMEIQTRNPNIRIIWFSQREQKHAPSNSKGI